MTAPGRPGTGIVLLLLAFTAGGCQSFEQRFSAIESRQNALAAQLADLQSRQETLIDRLVQVRRELDGAMEPLRVQSADRGEDMRSMRREVSALEEQIALLDERIARMSEQLAVGRRDAGPSQPGVAMPPPRGARAPSERAGEAATEPADSEAGRLWQRAYNDYLGESYELCVQGFEEYIRRYRSSQRAADAQYWIGECHAAQGNATAARQAFQTLIREYPSSSRIPDAMFKEAVILKDEGRNEAAAEAFRRLIQAYPTGDPAFLACRQLDILGADKPAACDEMD